MEQFFPASKIQMTGNPVRKDILNVAKRQQAFEHFGLEPDKPTVLVIGGSQGAKTINESIDGGLTSLVNEGCQVVWQTGKLYIERAKIAEVFKGRYMSLILFTRWIWLMLWPTLLCRAGALSVSELCLAGKPSI
jgi:UDP-N-acetylglucosamine--N-acetylmuramyl-(pentapeptide) pyrophosphoryl-undecaprenol N-acetylglucosamine transferase